jgi:hypothetical protein
MQSGMAMRTSMTVSGRVLGWTEKGITHQALEAKMEGVRFSIES